MGEAGPGMNPLWIAVIGPLLTVFLLALSLVIVDRKENPHV